MLKITDLTALARPNYTRIDENEANMESDNNIVGNVGDDKINNNITYMSNSIIIKKSSKIGFFNSKASLAFSKLNKVFIEALILYYYNLKHYIHNKTDILGHILGRVLS